MEKFTYFIFKFSRLFLWQNSWHTCLFLPRLSRSCYPLIFFLHKNHKYFTYVTNNFLPTLQINSLKNLFHLIRASSFEYGSYSSLVSTAAPNTSYPHFIHIHPTLLLRLKKKITQPWYHPPKMYSYIRYEKMSLPYFIQLFVPRDSLSLSFFLLRVMDEFLYRA